MTNETDNFPHYADFLVRIFNRIFPPLTKKGVEFYKWYFANHKPSVQIYSSSDLEETADILSHLREGNNIEELAEWLQRQPIADAAGVMDAIQVRIEEAQLKPRMLPGHPDGCVEAVRFALLELARKIDEQS